MVTSFNPWSVAWAREREPQLITGLLTDPGVEAPVALAFAREQGHPWVLPFSGMVTAAGPSWPADVHALGMSLGTWVVDDPTAALALMRSGVDAVATNDPGPLVTARRRGARLVIWRRKRLPEELEGPFEAFGAVLAEVEPAKAALTEVMPTTRMPGVSLPDALVEFEARLSAADALMPAWRRPEVEQEWVACDAGLRSASRAGPPLPGGPAGARRVRGPDLGRGGAPGSARAVPGCGGAVPGSEGLRESTRRLDRSRRYALGMTPPSSLPVGETVEIRAADAPSTAPMEGRFVRLVPVEPGHATALFAASHGDETTEAMWTYMPYGPFADEAQMRSWLEGIAGSDDPRFFTVIDLATGDPVGVVSYLNIVAPDRRIELGHIWYVPAAQRGRANTETAYLLMRQAFDELGLPAGRVEMRRAERPVARRGRAARVHLRGRVPPAHDREGPQPRHGVVLDHGHGVAGPPRGDRDVAGGR